MDLKLIVQAAKCQLLKVQQRKMHFWWIIGKYVPSWRVFKYINTTFSLTFIEILMEVT